MEDEVEGRKMIYTRSQSKKRSRSKVDSSLVLLNTTVVWLVQYFLMNGTWKGGAGFGWELISFMGQDVGSGWGTRTPSGIEKEPDTQFGAGLGQHEAKEAKEKSELEWKGISPPYPVWAASSSPRSCLSSAIWMNYLAGRLLPGPSSTHSCWIWSPSIFTQAKSPKGAPRSLPSPAGRRSRTSRNTAVDE